MQATINKILDDLSVAEENIRRFEKRFGLSSADFHALYAQGRLDNGKYGKEFSEWSAYYQIKLDRQNALETFSHERLDKLTTRKDGFLKIDPTDT